MERKLELINEMGERLNLLDNRTLLLEISDFGLSRNTDFSTIGTKFLSTKSEFGQVAITGTMYFKGKTPYEDYYRFINGYSNQELTLVYSTIKEFKLKCTMSTVKKKENTKDYRQIEVTFLPLGLWYESVGIIHVPTEDQDRGKQYAYEYAYKYSRSDTNSLTIETETTIPSPTRLTIYGPCTNPIWTQYANGVVIGTGKLNNVSLTSGQKLVIDSITPLNSIEVQNLNGKTLEDVYRYSDFSTERFFYLRKGTNVVTVNESGGTPLTFILEGELCYESV